MWDGIEMADSIVWNPHKWLGASMECSAHFIKDPEVLVKTLAIQPAYLETHGKDGIINFSEWGIQLGRRFRALKLWFLIRAYGLEGIQQRIRNHVKWANNLADRLQREDDFEVVTTPILSLFSFRYTPASTNNLSDQKAREARLAEINRNFLETLNDEGTVYLTQTTHEGAYVIRFVAGQFDTEEKDIDITFDVITRLARNMNV